MNCNHCNNTQGGINTTNTQSLNKIRRGNPFYINLSVRFNGEDATPEQLRDISMYLIDDRGNRTHLYDMSYEDNIISARVETDKVGRYNVEVIYHPQGRRERIMDITNAVEIVATSEEESINGEPITSEIIGINLTADMVVSLVGGGATTPSPQTLIGVRYDYANKGNNLQVSYDNGGYWETLPIANVTLPDQQATLREVIASLIAKTDAPTTANTPQTKIRVSEEGRLEVSYDGNEWVHLDISQTLVMFDRYPVTLQEAISELLANVMDDSKIDSLGTRVMALEQSSGGGSAELYVEEGGIEKLPLQDVIYLIMNEIKRLERELTTLIGGIHTEVALKTDLADIEERLKLLENR